MATKGLNPGFSLAGKMCFRGLIFDIDHVFFDGSYWHRLLHQMVCRLGKREEFENFRNQWQINYLPKVYRGEIKYWDAMASFFCAMGLEEIAAHELIRASQAKLKVAQENLRPYPKVPETLMALKKRPCRLGIISNSIHQSQALAGILADIKIQVPFDFILTSRSAGQVLPNADAFSEAARAMLLKPGEIGYVSTRLDRLQHATNSGLRPIWLRSNETPDASCPQAFSVIQHFEELQDCCFATEHEFNAA